MTNPNNDQPEQFEYEIFDLVHYAIEEGSGEGYEAQITERNPMLASISNVNGTKILAGIQLPLPSRDQEVIHTTTTWFQGETGVLSRNDGIDITEPVEVSGHDRLYCAIRDWANKAVELDKNLEAISNVGPASENSSEVKVLESSTDQFEPSKYGNADITDMAKDALSQGIEQYQETDSGLNYEVIGMWEKPEGYPLASAIMDDGGNNILIQMGYSQDQKDLRLKAQWMKGVTKTLENEYNIDTLQTEDPETVWKVTKMLENEYMIDMTAPEDTTQARRFYDSIRDFGTKAVEISESLKSIGSRNI